MGILSIDIETYSELDLTEVGVYKYAENFEILLVAYAFNADEPKIIDLASGENLPEDFIKAMTDPKVLKTAWNANFERTCLSRYLGVPLPIEQWHCSMVHALYLGLPASLEDAAKFLGTVEQKDTQGKLLINYFSKPCKPAKANNNRTRNLPCHAPDKWDTFKSYCVQDVKTEIDIRQKLEKYPVPQKEWTLYHLDQKINDYGIAVDAELVQQAIACDSAHSSKIQSELINITGISNPRSVSQLTEWFRKKGENVENGIGKTSLEEMRKATNNDTVKKVIGLRKQLAKSSIKKYEAMARSLNHDNRVRGLFQFYGANRTGRWAGRLIQVQNLPQNKIEDIHIARELLKNGYWESLELLYDSVPDILSQLVRTAFIPRGGYKFVVADFSAIEARVVAWLAGEEWVLEVFRTHGKIYEATAAQMFKVPIEKIAKGNPEYALRQKGKVAVLACGYQGGVKALESMGALKMGLTENELAEIVSCWRNANQNIVNLWHDAERAAIEAVKYQKTVPLKKGVRYRYAKNFLFADLPSGRSLSYPLPGIERENGREVMCFVGVDQISKKWVKQTTYGGKLVENLVQAIARDCLAESMLALDKLGYEIVMHVHDELVLEVPKTDKEALPKILETMGKEIPWAKGLPLRAEGFATNYYQKD